MDWRNQMSWIVRNLILDKYNIISNITETRHDSLKHPTIYGDLEIDDLPLMYTDDDAVLNDNVVFNVINMENDEYTFLLQLETKINDLHKSGQLSNEEKEIIQLIAEGNSYKEVGEKLNLGKNSVRKIFVSSCQKLAFSLGGLFTDEGYVEYMTKKYSLDETDVAKMIVLMESNRRL